MDETKMKRCPFCGGGVSISLGRNGQNEYFFISGCSCNVMLEGRKFSPESTDEEKAEQKNRLLEIWNARGWKA